MRREQLLALRARRRVAEPVGRAERRDGERVGLAQREVGERGQARLEAVDDVERPAGERERQVRADADRDAHLRAARDRDGRPDGDHVARRRVPVDDAPAGEQVGGARRGREHGHRVPERAQSGRDPGDVLVHVVRLRPRERRHEADAHCELQVSAAGCPLRGARSRGGRARLRRTLGRLGGAGVARLAPVPLDELLGQLVRLVVDDLLRRRLHQVRARALERAGDAVVQRELREPDGVDHDPGRVRRVPHLELELDVERHVAERRALHADVGPLAVGQPRHVVGRADVDVARAEVVVEHRGDRVRLRDLLRLEPLALEHVEEVGVAADVQLHRLVEVHAALAEERGEHAVRDRGADLRLDVVADDRHAGLLEAALPVRLARDEDRHAVHHRAAGRRGSARRTTWSPSPSRPAGS